MKLRTTSLLVAACSALTLTLGANAAGAASQGAGADRQVASDVEEQVPDGDGGNPGLSEPAGVGAPQGLADVGEWTLTTTDAQGRTDRFGDLPGDVSAGATQQQSSAVAAAGSWWDGQCGSNSKRFGFRSPSGSTFDRQVVILGRTGVRIMTAFPSTNSDYCQGTRI